MENAKVELIVNRQDDDGNRLSYSEKDGAIHMSQSNEPDRWRPIGRIIEDDSLMIYSKYEKEKDKYRKFKAWSVYYILFDIFDAVRYETESFVYYITKEDLLKFGKHVRDKGHGMGRKIVCPIRYWTVFPKDKSYKSLLKQLGYEWFDELHTLFREPSMVATGKFIRDERKAGPVYPSSDLIFRPFRETPYVDTKVVLLDIAPLPCFDGLAFSQSDSNLGVDKTTESLLDQVEDEVYDGFNLNRTPDLSFWAHQGVLLLNSAYTANMYGRESHKHKGWEDFNRKVFTKLMTDQYHSPVVFILLGDNIGEYYDHILKNAGKKHLVLTGQYPGGKVTNKVFLKCNDFLTANGIDPINW